ncbi:MAG: hypothetical protein R3B71_04415 [Candidatus Gracilibacteria bacterium]
MAIIIQDESSKSWLGILLECTALDSKFDLIREAFETSVKLIDIIPDDSKNDHLATLRNTPKVKKKRKTSQTKKGKRSQKCGLTMEEIEKKLNISDEENADEEESEITIKITTINGLKDYQQTMGWWV